MLRSWKIGQAFGIPLYLHWSFLLVPVLLAFFHSDEGMRNYLFWLLLAAGVFVCVMLHELGHALMARRFGVRTLDITLYPIGGVARLEKLSSKPWEEVLIASAGPAVNVAIVALLVPLFFLLETWAAHAAGSKRVLGPVEIYVLYLGVCNVALFLFNMLPIFPMDGGRVLRAVLTMFLGPLRATAIAANIGLVLALGLAVVGILRPEQRMLVPVAFFVVVAGRLELLAVRRREAARAARAAERALSEDPDALLLAEPRQSSINDDEEIETIAVPTHLDGSTAQAETRPARGGFTGLIWDRDAQMWVRWHDGRPMAAYEGPS